MMINAMSALFLVGLANAAMVIMKKMFIVNCAKYWMNGLKFMKKMRSLYLQASWIKSIQENFS